MGYRYLNAAKNFANEFSLMKLWLTYGDKILNSIGNIDNKILANVEKIISKFNREESRSMCSRYLVTRAQNRKESVDSETVNLLNIKEVIDRMIYYFDWQWDMNSHYENLKSEMIADMYREFWN